MKLKNKFFKNSKSAFSMLELVSSVVLIAVLVLIGIFAISKIRPAVEATKLTSDVQKLNSAIAVYQHNGGDLTTVSTAQEVLVRLKTMREQTSANAFVGFTGSTIDLRTALKEIDSGNQGVRAIYDPIAKKFKITSEQIDGFHFEMNDGGENLVAVEENRQDSALTYSSNGGWVWEYEDVPSQNQLTPTSVALTPVQPVDPTSSDSDNESVNDPATTGTNKLLPPTFSIESGVFPLEEFAIELVLTDPNESPGRIVYAIVSGNDWKWLYYSGPIQVGPGDRVSAYVESPNRFLFRNSDSNEELYEWRGQLPAPSITASPNEIDARLGSTTIEITSNIQNSNGQSTEIPENSFTIEYKLIPLVAGQGTETDWTRYNTPFSIGGPQFPRGFEVVARSVGSSSNYTNSSESRETITAFQKLDPPLISSTFSRGGGNKNDTPEISLENPNPIGSSTLELQVYDVSGDLVRDWQAYSAPITLGDEFSEGYHVVARAIPSDSFYRISDNSEDSFSGNFLGLDISGGTIFVLDSSRSMRNGNRIGQLQSAMTTIISGFNEDEAFAIIDYDRNATLVTPWGQATESQKSAATDAIANLSPFDSDGGTNYHEALQTAVGIASEDVTQVVFLSDGRPYNVNLNDERSTDGILELVDDLLAVGVDRVDTIAFGVTTEILQEMAARGQGSNVFFETE